MAFLSSLRESIERSIQGLIDASEPSQTNRDTGTTWNPPAQQASQPTASATRESSRPTMTRDAALLQAQRRYPSINTSWAQQQEPAQNRRAPVDMSDQGALFSNVSKDRASAKQEGEKEDEAPEPTNWAARDLRLATSYELTDEEFHKLNPQQRDAVLFNTGLVSAAQADAEAGNSRATRDYLSQLGIDPRSGDELNEYLQLDRAIGQNLLDKLGQQQQQRPPFKTQEAPETDLLTRIAGPRNIETLTPENRPVTNALSDSKAAASALADQLRSTGLFFGEKQQDRAMPGYGTSMHDDIVRKMYGTMVDSQYDLTADDVVSGLAEVNQETGASVTPEEVWSFLDAQLSAAELGGGEVMVPTDTDRVSGKPIKALKPEEIRKRYGL